MEERPVSALAAEGTPRSTWLRTLGAALVGIALLGLLMWHTGLDPIHDRMAELGARGPLVLLPYAVIALMDALGWRCTLPARDRAKVPLRSLYFIRMAGEGVNSITPAATVGGEGVKVYLLRDWGVPGSDAVASLVISKTALTVAQSFFVLLGLGALFARLGLPAIGAAWLAVLLVVFCAFTFGLVGLQRRNPAQMLWRVLGRLLPRARLVSRLERSAVAVDERLASFYGREADTFWRAALLHLAGWLIGVLEVQLIMVLIGSPIPLLDSLVIEALSQVVRATALVIPGGLGTQEIGGVALCTFLGIAQPAAVTLWLLKRGRELVFDGTGVLYLALESARRRRVG